MKRSRFRSNDRGGEPAGWAWLPSASAVLVPLLALMVVASLATGARAENGQWSGYDNQPLRVNVWHGDGQDEVYRRGEAVRISFETNQDAYAVVYRIDAEGEVTVLWPRSRFDDGFVFGGHTYVLPTAGAPRLRAGPEEGVEYVEAVVSVYPFDLRELEVDFHDEDNDEPYRFVVAGDPFLAMNEVNYAITRMDSPEDYVVTNYASYYVDRKVEHPRYMCAQCHSGDQTYDPYADTCVIAIHHDYGWANRWYVRYGWYPVYCYPSFYYVDPWSYSPWVNYWYTPWYSWPSAFVYDWPYNCYVWHSSPYWHGDAWTRWQNGDRRYVPLDKGRYQTEGRQRVRRIERENGLVRTARPTRDIERLMEQRTRRPELDGALVGEGRDRRVGGGYVNVGEAVRSPVSLRGGGESPDSPPGLRVRDSGGPRQGRVLGRPADGGRGTGRVETGGPGQNRRTVRPSRAGEDAGRAASPGERDAGERRTIRPVETRKPGTRIWSGGRSGTGPERADREPSRADAPRSTQSRERIERTRSERQDAPPRGSSGGERGPQRGDSDSGHSGVRESDSGRGNESSSPPARSGSGAPARPSGGNTRGRGGQDGGGRR